MFNILTPLLYLSILSISFLMTKQLYNKWLLPNTIFTALWSFCGIFSMHNNLDLVKPSFRIHVYILISICVFNLVYFIFMSKRFSFKIIKFRYKKVVEIDYKKVYILMTFGILLILPNTIKALQVLANYGFNMDLIRQEVYVELSNSGSHIGAFFTKNIPQAIFSVISLIGALDLVQKRYKIVPLAILAVILPTLTFGGRHAILNFVIFYMASFLILKKYKKVKIKKRYILLGVLILIIITYSRGLGQMSFLDMLIMYFAGSFSYLEVIINNPGNFGLSEPLLWGYLTLGFIFEPIILGLKLLIGINCEIPGYYFNIYMQPFVNIGEYGVKLFNNNSSMIYTFLRDFGNTGVVIGPAFLSWLICVVQSQYEKYKDIRWLLVLIYMYTVILNSTMSYILTSIGASLVFLVIIIIGKNKYKGD